MQNFSIHDEIKLKDLLKEYKIKPFRYSQIENAIYKNFIKNFDDIKTIPKDLQKLLQKNCFFDSLKVDSINNSSNKQTTKILFKTKTDKPIESVIMRHLTGRITLCVSSQSGCPMNCAFCSTGKLGLLKNLEFHEIIEQIFYAYHLINDEGERLRNVVFMGMGEPMLNYDNVKKAINFITDQKKLDLSNRRITVSTCGIVPKIKEFTNDFSQISLAISLHAPNSKIRKQLMPIEKTYPLKDLMKSLDDHVNKINRKIFYEYTMIEGINDNIKLAHELGKLLKGRLAHVNFIPYNSSKGNYSFNFVSSPRSTIEKFQKILQHYGVVSTIRATMGENIDAACGQLASREL